VQHARYRYPRDIRQLACRLIVFHSLAPVGSLVWQDHPQMEIDVAPAPLSQKPVVRRLLEFNAHDFSEIDGQDLGPHGEFGYPYLDHYWTEDDRHPFLIRVAGHIAGVVLVRSGEPHQIAEFFVLGKYRRRGIGLAAAREVLRRFAGSWEVHEIAGNDGAVNFWRRAIPHDYQETADESGTTQRFIAD